VSETQQWEYFLKCKGDCLKRNCRESRKSQKTLRGSKYASVIEAHEKFCFERFNDFQKHIKRETLDFFQRNSDVQIVEWNEFWELQLGRWKNFKLAEKAVLEAHCKECESALR
jgi:hypothetical protein